MDKEYKIAGFDFTCEKVIGGEENTLTLITEKKIDNGYVDIQIHLYLEDNSFHYTISYFDEEGHYYMQNDKIDSFFNEFQLNECKEKMIEISKETND